MVLEVQKVRPDAALPKQATPGSAGSDLHAAMDGAVSIPPGETKVISTGLAISLPEGWGGFIFARSGLGVRHGIVPAYCVGVIVSDYRGEVLVALHNQGVQTFTVEPGDRIAQLVLLPVGSFTCRERDALEETQRGEGGFGSTGR